MLVITRKPLQSFVIGPDIKVTIMDIDRGKVRVAIEAPREVLVLRTELLEGHRNYGATDAEAGKTDPAPASKPDQAIGQDRSQSYEEWSRLP